MTRREYKDVRASVDPMEEKILCAGFLVSSRAFPSELLRHFFER